MANSNRANVKLSIELDGEKVEKNFARFLSTLNQGRPNVLKTTAQLIFWLTLPKGSIQQPSIGFEKSCPDFKKHFERLPKLSVSFLSTEAQTLCLHLNPKGDTKNFIKTAFKRYRQKRTEPGYTVHQHLRVDSEGIIKSLYNWQRQQSLNYSLTCQPAGNCKLDVFRATKSENPRQKPYKYGDLALTWIEENTGLSSWNKAVESTFFGSSNKWEPMSFQKPIENLTPQQIKNRIATLGESIGWTPERSKDVEKYNKILPFHQEALATCFFCCDTYPIWKMACVHCQHASCVNCVTQNFKMCLKDTSLFPPRCCHRFPQIYASIASQNTDDLTKLARWIVTDKQGSSITQCYNCKTELYAGSLMGDIAFCVACEERTCVKCGIQWHEFERVNCQVGNLRDLVNIISQKKWSQCYKCGLVVEKSSGCAHMICRCGAGFCYHCGGQWPKCPCRTTGTRTGLNIKRDGEGQDSGQVYTKLLRKNHSLQAEKNEKKVTDTVEALKFLGVLKVYQANVVQQIGDLRKLLMRLREEGKETNDLMQDED
ncbi:hypothetical protein TWF694_007242 [Orbilia ellipsospora]|uniref:RING-type domain-containing protein n=1 Tax=Orbilia ellipsospora TaxID=2528407 RepID=A0AAV9XIS4_9PEZI